MLKLRFHADAGHAWLAVKRDLLEDLDLEREISTFSYQRGKTVYLEEDKDARRFLVALKEKEIDYEVKWPHKWPNRSPIRSYERYQP